MSKKLSNKLNDFLNRSVTLHSLKVRIFILILVIGIFPCAMIRQGILRSYEERAVEQRTLVMQNQLKILADHLINEDYLNSPLSLIHI